MLPYKGYSPLLNAITVKKNLKFSFKKQMLNWEVACVVFMIYEFGSECVS